MKIAILTHPLWTNYGGILQAYALQTYLRRQGHSVVVLNREYSDFPSLRLFLLRVGIVVKNFFRVYFLGKKQYVVMNPLSAHYHNLWSGYDVQPFVKKYICQSKELRNTKALRKYLKQNKFDCFIVGSDQVWRPAYVANVTDYFLKEVPNNSSALKVAYAASFGVDRWEFAPDLTEECSCLAKRFDGISVREKSGIRLCKEFLGIEAEHVLDPTMLLDAADYMEIIDNASTYSSEGNAFCYILDESPEVASIISDIEAKGFNLFKASLYVVPTDENARPYQMNVEQWLRSFRDAEFVITDSFHACVFSILFRKPFAAWVNKERGSSRFESLLEMFGMKNRLIYSIDDFNNRKDQLFDNSDLSTVGPALDSLRRKSHEFFEKAGII